MIATSGVCVAPETAHGKRCLLKDLSGLAKFGASELEDATPSRGPCSRVQGLARWLALKRGGGAVAGEAAVAGRLSSSAAVSLSGDISVTFVDAQD